MLLATPSQAMILGIELQVDFVASSVLIDTIRSHELIWNPKCITSVKEILQVTNVN